MLSDIVESVSFECSIIELLSLLAACISVNLAIYQWKKTNDFKRAEFVYGLITKLRDDKDFAIIFDLIDWGGVFYDGVFHVEGKHRGYADDERYLFKKIDDLMSYYSYICYLKKNGCIKRSDMVNFDYEIRRIVDNDHFANYLYTLYHWSKALSVECTFIYLITYAFKKGYLDKCFFSRSNYENRYTCYLELPSVDTL